MEQSLVLHEDDEHGADCGVPADSAALCCPELVLRPAAEAWAEAFGGQHHRPIASHSLSGMMVMSVVSATHFPHGPVRSVPSEDVGGLDMFFGESPSQSGRLQSFWSQVAHAAGLHVQSSSQRVWSSSVAP